MDLTSNILEKYSIEELQKLKQILKDIPDPGTLKEYASYYENYIKDNCSASYLSSVKISFNHLTKYLPENISLSDIKQRDIENFVSVLKQKVPRGYRIYFRTLKAGFNKAVEWDMLNDNPFRKIKLPKRQKLMPVFLAKDDISKVSDFIDSEIIKDFVLFTFNTGLRREEVCSLEWTDVNLLKKIITIGSEDFTTKTREQRSIPLSLEAYNILVKYYPKKKNINVSGNYVFTKANGFRFSGEYISKQFKKAVRAAGLDERITYHSLRHSCASYLVQKGISIFKVSKWLGHTSVSTTEIYSHLNSEDLREAAECFDREQLNNNYQKTIEV